MKIFFLIRGLDTGGAERQLVALAEGLVRRGHSVTICVYYRTDSPLEIRARRAGVRVLSLDKRGRWDIVGFTRRMVRFLESERPDALHGYLVTSNIVAALMQWRFPRMRIVWGIRASDIDVSNYDWTFRMTFLIAKLLAPWADRIIVNSEAGRRYHMMRGYPGRKITVIPNGIDTNYFIRDEQGAKAVRKEFRLDPGDILIGMVARLDPVKDHPAFIQAASLFAKAVPRARFICVGDGPEAYRDELKELAASFGLARALIWASERSDLPAVYTALDVVTLTSVSEGFPNVLAEAMACGASCVATNAGDSAAILGPLGEIVEAGRPSILAEAWGRALRNNSPGAAPMRRSRVEEMFSLESLVSVTERVLMEDPVR